MKRKFYVLTVYLLAALILSGCWPSSFRDVGTSEEDADTRPFFIIDAGHGGEDAGAIGQNGCLEKDLNLDISRRLADILTLAGCRVIMTRREDILLYDRNTDYKGHKKSQDLAARRALADENPDAVFVSIHMNTFPAEKYHGLQIYYSENDEASLGYAEAIRESVTARLQPENRRASKSGDGIYLLERITSPALLIECGFISNREECAALCRPDYRAELALVIADGLLLYKNGRIK